MLPSLFPTDRRPEHGFLALQQRINRMFEEFFGGPTAPSGGGNGALMPAIDVKETDKSVEIQAEMPGVDIKDVDVSYANGVLNIRAEKKAAKEKTSDGTFVSERSYGLYQRALTVNDVDPDKIDARLEAGVLKVTLPKLPAAQAKTKKIPVRAAA